MAIISQQQGVVDFDRLRVIGRLYLDVQQLRVACRLRILKLNEAALVAAGAANIVTTETKSGAMSRKLEIIDQEKADQITEQVLNSEKYTLVKAHELRLQKQEKDLLHESVELYANTNIWKWCESVKGLGEVAAMTFLSTIDPVKATSAGKVWAYLGYTPNSKLESGKQAKHDPYLKGRFWMVTNNVIMAGDPYYATLYRVKKEYYAARPDIASWKDQGKKGYKGHIDHMAKRWLIKLIASHAWELIRISIGETVNPHRWYIPIKPQTEQEQLEVIEKYRIACTKMLSEWPNVGRMS